jgi:hypothetical protein
MRKRFLMSCLGFGLAVAALAAATSAPAEVLDNLGFFSDFEMLMNLEIIEAEKPEAGLNGMPAAPEISTAAATAAISSETVKASTSTQEAI